MQLKQHNFSFLPLIFLKLPFSGFVKTDYLQCRIVKITKQKADKS
ncbi:hypothetical protein HMPREF1580_01275 [Gardnerella vaginalis JCP8070]|nr:hypothetical protein HMPREF1580_01275 [Gardnerella vaginalis JCP8070]